jgi:hypothetical protein
MNMNMERIWTRQGDAVFLEEDREFVSLTALLMICVNECVLHTEYRYWSFMEAHSAHNSLPAKAKMEAMDVLTWTWMGNGFFYPLAPLLLKLFLL